MMYAEDTDSRGLLVILLFLQGTGSSYIREQGKMDIYNGLDPASTTASLAGPYFALEESKNVTALLGQTAYLNCRVKNIGNRTVSWIRHRDIHLLTVGRYTYTNDLRFRAIHKAYQEDWVLQIKYPQHRDSGLYECQISTTPVRSHYIYLTIVEPSTMILGGPEMYINKGSTLNLTCIVKFSPEPPAYIFWNHNNNIISYDSPRGGVSVITEKGDTTTSYLLIQKAEPSDSGTYSCAPSNAIKKSIVVHVLNGEHPAAMQHGGDTRATFSIGAFCICVIISLSLL